MSNYDLLKGLLELANNLAGMPYIGPCGWLLTEGSAIESRIGNAQASSITARDDDLKEIRQAITGKQVSAL